MFKYLPECGVSILEKKEYQDLLHKWSLLGHLHCQAYSFHHKLSHCNWKNFLQEFLEDEEVKSTLWIQRGNSSTVSGCSLQVRNAELVQCTLTSMDVFEALFDKGIVCENGDIKLSYPEYLCHFSVDDELQKALLIDDSEPFLVFDAETRREFLFIIFNLLVIGGECCQHDDNIKNYLVMTKGLYKDLVRVAVENGEIVIKSTVVQLQLCQPEPCPHFKNYVFLVIDSNHQVVKVLQHTVGKDCLKQ